MINALIRKRVAEHSARNQEISPEEIENAETILFAVSSRYGDSIIAFKVINEFINTYIDKKYFLITTHQNLPYAKEIVKQPIITQGINKRNIFQFFNTVLYLKKSSIDIGFNPWSFGESTYLITFAKRFYSFSAKKSEKATNLYFRARDYLGLQHPEKQENLFVIPRPARQILLSPFSTDVRKSLSREDVITLLTWLKTKFNGAHLTISMGKKERHLVRGLGGVNFFMFGKSEMRSRQFLELLKKADLFVGVDAGPLHLADALGKPCIGIFGPTAPELIMDTTSHILPVRLSKLRGIFCDVNACREPQCIHALFQRDLEHHRYMGLPDIELEQKTCRLEV